MRLPREPDDVYDASPCHACTGTGFETTDPEDSSPCLRCGGTGEEPDPDPTDDRPYDRDRDLEEEAR